MSWLVGTGGTAQRGAALLLALVLTVSLSLLAITVLAGRDMAVAVADQGALRQRAHRAAASGVEWAAAKVMSDGLVAATTKFVLATGEEVVVDLQPTNSPQVVAKGRCDGAEVQLGADLRVIPAAAPPFAYMSYAGTSSFSADVGVSGSCWFGDKLLPLTGGSKRLKIAGDVHLVTTVPIVGTPIQHTSGTTSYDMATWPAPVIDTTAIPFTGKGGVPVTDYSGSMELRGQVLSGIVRVTLGSGETFTLRNSTIAGTLVVVTTGVLVVRPRVNLRDGAAIVGGTTATGNLAVLAPDCSITGSNGKQAINGVVYANDLSDMNDGTFTGMIVTTAGMIGNKCTIERPAGFVPDTPLGLEWVGSRNCRIQWRGVQ